VHYGLLSAAVRDMLFDLYREKIGEYLPLIRRQGL
jgi:hypothetical protein